MSAFAHGVVSEHESGAPHEQDHGAASDDVVAHQSAGQTAISDTDQDRWKDAIGGLLQAKNASAPMETTREPDAAFEVAQAAVAADLRNVPIGQIEKVSGRATVMRNGVAVELHLGDAVYRGDVVETATLAAVTLKFRDGTVLALSAGSRVTLSEMLYTAGSTTNSVLFRLVDGIMGLVAGASAKSGEFAVETPTAVMGIRGTAVRVEILPNGATKFSLLREPNGTAGTLLLLDRTDHSRIIGSVTDTTTAAVVGLAATIVRVTKTDAELRAEGALVRDLFRHVENQRRGSSDFEDGFIIPALDVRPPPDTPELAPFTPVRATFPAIALDTPIILATPTEIVTAGNAIEDGPTTALGPDEFEEEIQIVPPPALPAGVSFNAVSGQFRLDPSHQAYQHLGVGESLVVEVRYTIVEGNSVHPAVISWAVAGRNDAPIARPDTIEVKEGGATALRVGSNDSDIDGDAVRVISWTKPLEGSVSLKAGQLVFTPGRDFEALSSGQTATVTFDYTISDPHGGTDTATARVRVVGEGTFSAPPISAGIEGVLPETGQSVQMRLQAPSRVTAPTAEVMLDFDFGLVPARSINIVYVIDVSGSTDSGFVGDPVGDLNQDGRSNTILDAEIASLISLTDRIRALGFSPSDVTITLIPFNSEADPAEERDSSGDAIVFDLGFSGDETIANALRSLQSGGGTDFEQALQATIGRLATLDPAGQEENFVYFLSDGAGSGSFEDEVAALRDTFGAQIAATGIGDDAILFSLVRIDSDGQVERLTSLDGLETSLVGTPRLSGEIIDVDLFVNGQEVVGIGPEDVVLAGADYVLRAEVGDLARFAGDISTVTATVTFTGGLTLTTAVDVFGALPRSTDLDL